MIKARLSLYMWFGRWRTQSCAKKGVLSSLSSPLIHIVLHFFDLEYGLLFANFDHETNDAAILVCVCESTLKERPI